MKRTDRGGVGVQERPAGAGSISGHDWYDEPTVYDILHAPGTPEEVDGLERIESRFAGPGARRGGRRWFEPACGSGRYLREAWRRGIGVAGIDLSPAMIGYARAWFDRRGGSAELIAGDMTGFTLKRRAGFAFCMINSLRHLMNDRQMLAHFACVARALRPGGVYAVGIEMCRYGRGFASEDIWEGRRGPCRVQQVVQYEPPERRSRAERVISHLVVTTPGSRRHLDTAYTLRSYDEGQWARLLARSALREIGVCDPSGDEALLAPDGGVVGGYAVRVLAPRIG